MKTYSDIVGDGGSDVSGQVEARSRRLEARLAEVGFVVAVMSGKGGVGKSTVAAHLADALAATGRAVGLLDADLNGPSLGRITGASALTIDAAASGVRPALTQDGLKVMSIDFFLDAETSPVVWDAPTQRSAYAWRGLREVATLHELVADTDWGALDYLIVDLPPGADRLPTVADVLPRLDGALVITIPSAVSMAAVGKSVRFVREHLDTPLLGIVENMTARVCPHCGRKDELFPEGSLDRLSDELRLPILARIPFDPALAAASDAGRSFLRQHPERAAARALSELAERVSTNLNERTQ